MNIKVSCAWGPRLGSTIFLWRGPNWLAGLTISWFWLYSLSPKLPAVLWVCSRTVLSRVKILSRLNSRSIRFYWWRVEASTPTPFSLILQIEFPSPIAWWSLWAGKSACWSAIADSNSTWAFLTLFEIIQILILISHSPQSSSVSTDRSNPLAVYSCLATPSMLWSTTATAQTELFLPLDSSTSCSIPLLLPSDGSSGSNTGD